MSENCTSNEKELYLNSQIEGQFCTPWKNVKIPGLVLSVNYMLLFRIGRQWGNDDVTCLADNVNAYLKVNVGINAIVL